MGMTGDRKKDVHDEPRAAKRRSKAERSRSRQRDREPSRSPSSCRSRMADDSPAPRASRRDRQPASTRRGSRSRKRVQSRSRRGRRRSCSYSRGSRSESRRRSPIKQAHRAKGGAQDGDAGKDAPKEKTKARSKAKVKEKEADRDKEKGKPKKAVKGVKKDRKEGKSHKEEGARGRGSERKQAKADASERQGGSQQQESRKARRRSPEAAEEDSARGREDSAPQESRKGREDARDRSKHQGGHPPDRRDASRSRDEACSESSSPPPPEQRRSASQEEVHHGISCNGCVMNDIKGDRFKCSVCARYNLCEKCYGRRHMFHPKDHKFYAQKASASDAKKAKAREQAAAALAAEAAANSSEDEVSSSPPPPEMLTATSPGVPSAAAAAALAGSLNLGSSAAPQSKGWRNAVASLAAAAGARMVPAAAGEASGPGASQTGTGVKKEKTAWMNTGTGCHLCQLPANEDFAGVICRRRRNNGKLAGCGHGVCWNCMVRTPRPVLGDVRTTLQEFKEFEEEEGQAWWMHEACMDKGDINDYFGGHKAYIEAKEAIDRDEVRAAKEEQVEWQRQKAVEAEKEKLATMTPIQLKQYLAGKGLPHVDLGLQDRDALLNRAMNNLAQGQTNVPSGPAWMPPGGKCKTCQKALKQEKCGVLCRRIRVNGSIAGCGGGACWRCMKRASRDEFGSVRTTKEEFDALGFNAWWMHERCMTPYDRHDYFADLMAGV